MLRLRLIPCVWAESPVEERKETANNARKYGYFGLSLDPRRHGEHDYIWRYLTNVRHADLFVTLEREARESDRGLWSSEACNGDI